MKKKNNIDKIVNFIEKLMDGVPGERLIDEFCQSPEGKDILAKLAVELAGPILRLFIASIVDSKSLREFFRDLAAGVPVTVSAEVAKSIEFKA